jgi:hypothetical protein
LGAFFIFDGEFESISVAVWLAGTAKHCRSTLARDGVVSGMTHQQTSRYRGQARSYTEHNLLKDLAYNARTFAFETLR